MAKPATETKSETKVEQAPQPPALAPERLPYQPQLQERFRIDRGAWRVLVDAIFPMARSAESVILALAYCRSRRLDIFKRPVHIVPMWNSLLRREVETVWPGIGELRTTAARTGQCAGNDEARFGAEITKTFSGTINDRKLEKTVVFPEWCQLTIYRKIEGQRMPFPGPRVRWLETYSSIGQTAVPNERWTEAPYQMLEKVAEASALRRAFPEELGNEYTAEEMAGKTIDVTPAVSPEIEAKTALLRERIEQAQAKVTDPQTEALKVEIHLLAVELNKAARDLAASATILKCEVNRENLDELTGDQLAQVKQAFAAEIKKYSKPKVPIDPTLQPLVPDPESVRKDHINLLLDQMGQEVYRGAGLDALKRAVGQDTLVGLSTEQLVKVEEYLTRTLQEERTAKGTQSGQGNLYD